VIGRRLSELYTPVSDMTMPFGLRWTLQGQGAYNLTQALSGAGYAGLATVVDLSTVHMLLFTGTGLNYLEEGQLVVTQGYAENAPARLRTLAAGDNIALETAGEVITVSTSAALTTLLSDLQAGIDSKQPAILSMPSAPGSGRYDLFDGVGIASLSAAVPLSIAKDGTNLALSLNSSGFQPAFSPTFPLSITSANLQLAIGPYLRMDGKGRGLAVDTASLEEIFSQYFVPHSPLSWTTEGTSTTPRLTLDLSGLQSTLSPVAPLSISNGTLTIDLTAYAKTSSLAAYAPKFTAMLPLTLSASNALSIDLSVYQGKITVSAPLAMSATNAVGGSESVRARFLVEFLRPILGALELRGQIHGYAPFCALS